MKTLIENANRWLGEDISEEEVLKVKRMLAEGIAMWHVKYDSHMKLVDAMNIQEIIDKMSGIAEFDTAKNISFNRMGKDSI